jgi:MFS family permease
MITIASVPALISKPIWGIFIDRVEPKRLTSLSSLLTGGAIVIIVFAVQADTNWLVYMGFVLLGAGWGGLIPLQEVTWASYFGRRYIGAVRSAGLPFSIGLGAAGPLLASLYYDRVGNYDGAFLIVAGSCIVAATLILFVKRPDVSPAAAA